MVRAKRVSRMQVGLPAIGPFLSLRSHDGSGRQEEAAAVGDGQAAGLYEKAASCK